MLLLLNIICWFLNPELLASNGQLALNRPGTELNVDARPLLMRTAGLEQLRKSLDKAYNCAWTLDERLTVEYLTSHHFWQEVFARRSDLDFVDVRNIEWALDEELVRRYRVISRMDPDLIALYFENPSGPLFSSIANLGLTPITASQFQRCGLTSILQVVKLIRQGGGRIDDALPRVGLTSIMEMEVKAETYTGMKLLAPLLLPDKQHLSQHKWGSDRALELFKLLGLQTIKDVIDLDESSLQEHTGLSSRDSDMLSKMRLRLLKRIRDEHCRAAFLRSNTTF